MHIYIHEKLINTLKNAHQKEMSTKSEYFNK